MKRILLVVLAFGLVMSGAAFALTRGQKPVQTPGGVATAAPTLARPPEASYRDATYEIDGSPITLVDGVARQDGAPGSSSTITTQIFGNESFGDLNGDGKEDVVFLLTQTGSGSGTFYYVVAALQTENGYEGSNAVLLGDRIAPQSTAIGADGTVSVNYADRRPDEPFTAPPSQGKTKYLAMVEGKLVESKTKLELTGQTWKWVKTQMNDDTLITPQKSEAFTITFGADGRVSGTTDCNNFMGSYTLDGNKLTFGALASTKMFCEGSQETEFHKYLAEVDSFMIADGQLVLLIKFDSGSMIFE